MQFFEICAEVLVPKFTGAEVRLPDFPYGISHIENAFLTI